MTNQESPGRNSFVFYRSFYEAIERLPDDVQLNLLRAIIKYGLDQDIPNFNNTPHSPYVEAIFAGIKPQLDANFKRFLNGCKGGAPIGSHNNPMGRKGKTNHELTKNKPNVNVNDNVNENDNENEVINREKQPVQESELKLPFQDQVFVSTWNELRQQPKWKSKTASALQRSLNQLSKYDVRFAVDLMENAIAGNYQGVVFDNTPEKYDRWLKNIANTDKDGQSNGFVLHDINELY